MGWILYFIMTIGNFKRLPFLSKIFSKNIMQSYPLVSIVVPTRNEEYRVEKCIISLKKQTYPNLEIIIVDDSTDNTIDIIKNIIGNDQRFSIIKQKKLPEGWIGKPFALQQGSTYAKGKWLVFIDADTYFEPELIMSTLDYAVKNNIDLLSLIPRHVCQSFWEKVIQPIPLGLIPAISPLAKVNKEDSKTAIAFGPFILIKHSVFDSVGGYQTIKGQIADDAEIAKLVKKAGFRLQLVNAQNMMNIRMYEKFSEIWEGWSKNIFLGLVQKRDINTKFKQLLVTLAGSIGIFGLMVFPFVATFISVLLVIFVSFLQFQHFLIFSIALLIISISVQYCIQKYYRIGDPKYALLSFLGGILTIGIFLNSAIKSLSGAGVSWKGRIYSSKKH
ncbi:MAG: glycosyltransferase family 2 protein [Candidatus Thermoplasmatota archaeon]|nr:glycosyltransferase family 2 protein [Candidatus Thermoplasmatota archaeon]